MTAPRDRRSSRKLLASIAVLGAAAAVAGLATYGTFTDSTAPISTEVASGTVSIDVSGQGYTIPVSTSGWVAGDSMSRAVDLVNDGSSELSSVSLASVATTSSVLTTDTTHGLQLAVQSCSAAWTQGGTASAPTYSCAGSTSTLYTGAVVMDAPLAGVASLDPAGVDHLLLTVSLPSSADTTFMGQSSTLELTFTGVQRAATAR